MQAASSSFVDGPDRRTSPKLTQRRHVERERSNEFCRRYGSQVRHLRFEKRSAEWPRCSQNSEALQREHAVFSDRPTARARHRPDSRSYRLLSLPCKFCKSDQLEPSCLYTYILFTMQTRAEDDEGNEAEGATYQLEMMRCLREINVDNNTVGWYASDYAIRLHACTSNHFAPSTTLLRTCSSKFATSGINPPSWALFKQ